MIGRKQSCEGLFFLFGRIAVHHNIYYFYQHNHIKPIMNENPISLQNPFNQSSVILRRRDLLSWWIKAFTWMFLLFGVFTPVAYIYGSLQPQFQLSMLG